MTLALDHEEGRFWPEEAPVTAAGFPLAGLDDGDLAVVLAPFDTSAVVDVYRLSALQTAILFQTLDSPYSGDYLTQSVYDIDGDLDVESFLAAWRHVIDRHEILRTTFAWSGLEHPVQIVHRSFRADVRHHDWSRRTPEQTEDALADLLTQARARGVELDRKPPMWFDLIKLPGARYRFVWHMHHILLDGWSAAIVLDEVRSAYAAIHREAVLPDLPEPVPYRRHIDWLVNNRDTDDAADYWRAALDGFESATQLPCIAASRSAVGVGGSATVGPTAGATRKVIEPAPETVARGLGLFARRNRITLHVVLQGAWALLLSRLSGDSDVLYGCVMSGRWADAEDVEQVVGMLVNTLPVRIRVDDCALTTDWFKGLHRQFSVLRKLEHCGLAEIQRHAKLPAGHHMFETVFVFTSFATNDSGEHSGDGELRMQVNRSYEQIGYPLGLTVGFAGGLTFQLTYESARVSEADAKLLLERYLRLLAQIADDDQPRAVGELTILAPGEAELLTSGWSGAVGKYESSATLAELFSRTVSRYPDAVALLSDSGVAGSGQMTYRELDAAANQVAQILHARGVRTDDIVGVSLPRSIGMIVALLGVVKAGGAYLSLDPANPAERNSLLIDEARVRVILVDSSTRHALGPAARACTQIVLDDPAIASELRAAPDAVPESAAAWSSLAQVCFTSGSTGLPKAVGIQHRGIVRLAHQPAWTTCGPGEVFIQLAPISFDASAFEIWAPLLNGGTLLVPPPGRLDVPDIARLLRDYQVTAASLITGMLHHVIEHDLGALASVRRVLTGGDVLLPEPVAAALRAHPHLKIVNCYGPTENTTVTTYATLPDIAEPSERIPIGVPLPHSTVYLLDESLRPVPAGVTGELYTGGDGLARGYLGHPAATAERFLPDPFSDVPGARMYRTGDQARWRGNGLIDFGGRADGQVKIRGYRIELGEIESRLMSHPKVAAAVVRPHADASGHKRLVAYIVPVPCESVLNIAEVREFVCAALPEYMSPAAVVGLDRLPLTSNGKVDRAALPAPAERHPVSDDQPATEAQQTLARIWAEVLGLSAVGVWDNFFDLGGDSILAMRVASEARHAGLPLTSRSVYKYQTVAELTAHLADAGGALASVTVTAEQGPVTGLVPLTPVQRRFAAIGGPLDQFNQSRLLRWRGTADTAALRGALAAIVAHHDALRLRYVAGDAGDAGDAGNWQDAGGWQQEITGVEEADLLRVVDLGEADQTTRLEAADELQRSLDLAAGPLLRAVLYRSSAGADDEVLLAIHHWAVDAVSWSILLRDLSTAYIALRAGRPGELPRKTTSFKAWAEHLWRHACSADFAPEARSWQASAWPAAPLPVDRPGGPGNYGSVSSLLTTLDRPHTAMLLRSPARPAGTAGSAGSGGSGASASEILIAALARTLWHWSRADMVTIDLEGHGREALDDSLDVSRTVGWFTAIYPVTLPRQELEDPRQVTELVRQRLRAVPHGGIGHGLAQYLAADRGGASAQVSFNYLGQATSWDDDAGPFTQMPNSLGQECHPGRPRPYLLDVVAMVADGVLQIRWLYSRDRHDAATIRELARRFSAELRSLLRQDTQVPGGAASLSRLFPGTPVVLSPMARYRVPGLSVAVLQDGDMRVWGHGVARAGSAVEVTPRTVFPAGSISKHLTAIAVLRLAQSSAVDLDADVNQYLAGWTLPSADHGHPVTLRHLLSHRAGLAVSPFATYRRDEQVPGLAELLAGPDPAGAAVRVVHEPGTAYGYAGVNYAVVEQVVTDVTGQPFATVMRQLVLDPLGMADSGFEPSFPATRGDAAAHGHLASGRGYEQGWRVGPSLAAGGLWTTPGDVALVAAEIRAALATGTGRVLTGPSADELFHGLAEGYGLGTVVKTIDGSTWFGHPGDAPGYRSLYAVHVDSGAGLIAFANGDAATALFEDMLAELGLDLVMRVQGPKMKHEQRMERL